MLISVSALYFWTLGQAAFGGRYFTYMENIADSNFNAAILLLCSANCSDHISYWCQELHSVGHSR